MRRNRNRKKKNYEQSRIKSQKALDRLSELTDKYPNGMPDISSLSDEQKAWIQLKINQFRECEKGIHYAGFKFNTPIRKIRNTLSHLEEDLPDNKFKEKISYVFNTSDKIKRTLEKNIERCASKSKEKKKFENSSSPLFGTKKDKKRLVDAMDDFITPDEKNDEKLSFPENKYAHIAKTLLENITGKDNSIKEQLNLHNRLYENVETDILKWIGNLHTTITNETPFIEEAIFIKQQEKKEDLEIAENISKIEYHYKRLPSVSQSKRGNIKESKVNFDFYKKYFKKLIDELKTEQNSNNIEHELNVYSRNLIKEMKEQLIRRELDWEQDLIDSLRKNFIDELYKKIQNFLKLEKLLFSFYKGAWLSLGFI